MVTPPEIDAAQNIVAELEFRNPNGETLVYVQLGVRVTLLAPIACVLANACGAKYDQLGRYVDWNSTPAVNPLAR